MGEKIVVGPISKGFRDDVTAFNVDNDSFPSLINAYQWRGRIKRKRGTSFFGRLTRYFDSNDPQFNPGTTTQVLGGGGTGNLLTGFTNSGIQSTAAIVPGSVTITDNTAVVTYTDPAQNGNLSPSGSINYATGDITIVAAAGHTIKARFNYYPDLPVLGLEPFVQDASDTPLELGFDQTYSYNLSLTSPYTIHSVSFYWNPVGTTYNGITYTAKTSWTPVKWNLADYQQIWSTNYSGAMWATPGIPSPFATTHLGMQFKLCATVVYGGNPTTLTITITEATQTLIIGDWVFINEVTAAAAANSATVNFQTGFVTAAANVAGTTTLTVRFPNAAIANAVYANGILQYLTNNSDSTKDCIRWYNGAPVNSAIPPVFSNAGGWVNFAPPLLSGPNPDFPYAGLPPAQYYLVGARMVVPFKSRLLFFGPVVQTSSGNPIYLQDTVIDSSAGNPYYTASFTGGVFSPTTNFSQLLVPTNYSSNPGGFCADVNGFGGFTNAGYARPITSVSINEDALIVGFSDRQARLLYTGNDLAPFNFYIINSELGSDSTFSTITLDRGVLSVGGRGFILTSQIDSQRIDLVIPDKVFAINLLNAGARRICAQRDFINEWVYFTYPSTESIYTNFPAETLQYNYRDDTWAVFKENYTTYGTIRKATGATWEHLNSVTWDTWNTPWNSEISDPLQPTVIGGNQQGFILERASASEGQTSEGTSLYIQGFAGDVVTSPSHGLENDDVAPPYVFINGCLGTVGQYVNGKIFKVDIINANTFSLNLDIPTVTYLGSGTITRYYVPYIQTKQFPMAWSMGRKTRIGTQRYLLSATAASEISLLIFLSQDSANAYNTGAIVPDVKSVNNALIYSTVLYTCPELENLGLTPAQINLQMPTAASQQQIWHRVNTSLIGDTVQLGFTISEDQMQAYRTVGTVYTITGATQANPCVLTCSSDIPQGNLIRIDDVVGMTQLNFSEDDYNYYQVLAVSTTTVTINVDATGFTAYASGGTATEVGLKNATEEVELHSFILDVYPSQELA